MITGGCLCGAVRYACSEAPAFAVVCHCKDCQRASGSGYLPVLGLPKAAFTVTGETAAYPYTGPSGAPTARHFCPACGSQLFGTPEISPDVVTVYAGTLDDPADFAPAEHIFTASRPAWEAGLPGLPELPGAPI